MFDDALLDDSTALTAADPALRSVAGWGAEVRRAAAAAEDALDRLRATAGSADERPRAVVAAGPDGRLVRAVLEPSCPVPFVAWPYAGLPAWAGPLDLVVVVSRTGAEEDARSTAGEALRRGASLLVAAPRLSPLAESVGSRDTLLPTGSTEPLALAVPLLCALHVLGLGPQVDAEEVADALDAVAARCSPARPADDNPAKLAALVLGEAVPVVWGGSSLAARAARRVAEALRVASGRPALSGDVHQLLPVLERSTERDIFADPYDDDPDVAAQRPAVLVLDDGADAAGVRVARSQLLAAAGERRVPVHTVTADEGADVGRYGSLLSTGRFAAAYLAVGLARPTP